MFLFYTNPILILAAILPAIWLMGHIYRADRREAEPKRLLVNLVWQGVLSTYIAMVLELTLPLILNIFVKNDESYLYFALYFFLIVGFSEELAKFYLMNRKTWNSPEFNCTFDGVVYATFVSLGFALAENINYVVQFGFSAALVRAVTAVPGHACFGVFMGAWYGCAKRMEQHGRPDLGVVLRVIALVTSILLHGAYDFIASLDTGYELNWRFILFVMILFGSAYILVNFLSRNDKYVRDVGRW